MSVKLNGQSFQLQIISDITHISLRLLKTIGQPPVTPTRHVAWTTLGDCVHITRESPATIETEDKTTSGKIYITDSTCNLLGLDFYQVTGSSGHTTEFCLLCNFQISSHYGVSKVKLATVVEGDQNAPFSVATTLRCRGRHYSFPWIAPLYP